MVQTGPIKIRNSGFRDSRIEIGEHIERKVSTHKQYLIMQMKLAQMQISDMAYNELIGSSRRFMG